MVQKKCQCYRRETDTAASSHERLERGSSDSVAFFQPGEQHVYKSRDSKHGALISFGRMSCVSLLVLFSILLVHLQEHVLVHASASAPAQGCTDGAPGECSRWTDRTDVSRILHTFRVMVNDGGFRGSLSSREYHLAIFQLQFPFLLHVNATTLASSSSSRSPPASGPAGSATSAERATSDDPLEDPNFFPDLEAEDSKVHDSVEHDNHRHESDTASMNQAGGPSLRGLLQLQCGDRIFPDHATLPPVMVSSEDNTGSEQYIHDGVVLPLNSLVTLSDMPAVFPFTLISGSHATIAGSPAREDDALATLFAHSAQHSLVAGVLTRIVTTTDVSNIQSQRHRTERVSKRVLLRNRELRHCRLAVLSVEQRRAAASSLSVTNSILPTTLHAQPTRPDAAFVLTDGKQEISGVFDNFRLRSASQALAASSPVPESTPLSKPEAGSTTTDAAKLNANGGTDPQSVTYMPLNAKQLVSVCRRVVLDAMNSLARSRPTPGGMPPAKVPKQDPTLFESLFSAVAVSETEAEADANAEAADGKAGANADLTNSMRFRAETAAAVAARARARAKTGVRVRARDLLKGGIDGAIDSAVKGAVQPIIKVVADGAIGSLAGKLVGYLGQGFTGSLCDQMVQRLVPLLNTELASGMVPSIKAALTGSLLDAVPRDLDFFVSNAVVREVQQRVEPQIVSSLSQTVPSQVEEGTSARLGLQILRPLVHVLSRSITHSVAPALTHVITHSPSQDVICKVCMETQKPGWCRLCHYAPLQSVYASYYAGVFTNWYGNYYADYYYEYFRAIVAAGFSDRETRDSDDDSEAVKDRPAQYNRDKYKLYVLSKPEPPGADRKGGSEQSESSAPPADAGGGGGGEG